MQLPVCLVPSMCLFDEFLVLMCLVLQCDWFSVCLVLVDFTTQEFGVFFDWNDEKSMESGSALLTVGVVVTEL